VGASEDAILSVIWWCLFIASICLVIGLFSRTAAVASWCLHLATVNSIGLLAYGVDNFSTIGTFYLMLSPLPHRWSVDHRLRGRHGNSEFNAFFRRILQLHVSMIYFFGGLAKCIGVGWWIGDSLWRALTRPPVDVLPIEAVASWSRLLPGAGIAVCLLEVSFPLLIWSQHTRRFCLL